MEKLLEWLTVGLTLGGAVCGVLFVVVNHAAKDREARERRRERETLEQQIAASHATAAQANAEAARANEEAAKAKLALEQYKTERAPRRLSGAAQRRIAEKLRPLSRIADPEGIAERVDLATFPTNAESTWLVTEIAAALQSATWNVSREVQGGDPLGIALIGVGVLTMPDSPKSSQCAKALAEALRAEGIETSIGPIPQMRSCRETMPNEPDRYKTDPYCSRVIVLVGDHP